MPANTSDDAKGRPRVDARALAKLVQSFPAVDGVVIEHVGAMPHDGRSSAFVFGRAAGIAEGVCAALGVPIERVKPQQWKHRLTVPADKSGARARATQLFGKAAGERYWKLAKHDGLAEAAMIALWGVVHGSALRTTAASTDW